MAPHPLLDRGAHSGHVELAADGVTYRADYTIVGGMVHVEIAGHRKVVAVSLAGATFEQSAAYILKLFVANLDQT